MVIRTADKRGGIGPSMRGLFYSYKQGDRYVVSAWPPARGKPKTEAQAQTQALFKEACNGLKAMDAAFINYGRDDSKSKPMLPRDALMAAGYGRGPIIDTLNGDRWYPMATRVDMSLLMDNLAFTPGSLLVRGYDDLWIGLDPGEPDQVLIMNEEGLPEWQTLVVDGGGGGAWVTQNPTAYYGTGSPCVASVFYPRCYMTLQQIVFRHRLAAGQQWAIGVYLLNTSYQVDAILLDQPVFPTADGTDRWFAYKFLDPVDVAPGSFLAVAFRKTNNLVAPFPNLWSSNQQQIGIPGELDGRYFTCAVSNPVIGTPFVGASGDRFNFHFQG